MIRPKHYTFHEIVLPFDQFSFIHYWPPGLPRDWSYCLPLNNFPSSASQILADLGAHLSTFKHPSNRPVSFGVSLSYFPVPLLNDIRIEKAWAFQLCSHFHLTHWRLPLLHFSHRHNFFKRKLERKSTVGWINYKRRKSLSVKSVDTKYFSLPRRQTKRAEIDVCVFRLHNARWSTEKQWCLLQRDQSYCWYVSLVLIARWSNHLQFG